MKPYRYQEPIISTVYSALLQFSIALMVLATGVGKTAISAFVTKLLKIKSAKVLFLCHDITILEQSAKTFSRICGANVRPGFFNGSTRPNENSNFIFATFQSLANHKKVFRPQEFNLLIVDEAHHAQAGTYAPVIKYFRPQYLLGMTATPNRNDTLCIREIFGKEVVNIGLEEAIAKKYLCPLDYRVFTDNLDTKVMSDLLKEHEDTGRRVSIEEINRSVFIEKRDKEVAKIIKRESGERVIIFCRNIEHAEEFSKQLPESRTTILHSKLKSEEQNVAHKGFKSGKYRYILVVDKYNEGVDVPEADTVVFLRSTDSSTIFLQQLGRGLRKSPGKKKLLVLDFVANCDRFHTIRSMIKAILKFTKESQEDDSQPFDKNRLRISGNGFSFQFSEDQLTLAELMERTKPRMISDIPKLLQEFSLNNPLPPEKTHSGTNQKLEWICSVDSRHVFIAPGNKRMLGQGCPYCTSIKVHPETNSLLITHPDLALEYSEKNKLPSSEVFAKSRKIFIWKCEAGHEWRASGVCRATRNSKCPTCCITSTKLPPEELSLVKINPELAKEYHPEKNKLSVEDLIPRDNDVYYWFCDKNHVWQARFGDRHKRKTKCPYCTNRKVDPKTNSLHATNPELAKEYHPEKNKLSAKEILAGSHKKYWWICEKGHEWEAVASDRKKGGKKCPICKI